MIVPGDANPLLIGGADGYQISRSVRLRSSASATFTRTPASATNRTTWTWSGWVKIGTIGTRKSFFDAANTDENNEFLFQINTSNVLIVQQTSGGSSSGQISCATNAVFRDPSAWYHIVLAVDTGNATSTNRIKIYVNNVLQTFSSYSASSVNTWVNYNCGHIIGNQASPNSGYLDGYLTEINFIDGQALTPSSFGATSTTTGVWGPIKYTGTYGTNGFYLNFSDNSSNTATTIGKDYSGNGNNWTPNNISVTAGTTYDSFTDVPTLNSSTAANYAVGNPLAVNVTTSSGATLADGNLYLNNSSANYSGFPSTMPIPTTGKWAWKFKVTGSVSGSNEGYIGFACNSSGIPVTGASSGAAANWYTTVQVQALSNRGVAHKYAGGSVVTDVAGSGGTGATGDEYEFLIDRDAGTTIIKLNGTTLTTVTGLPATQQLFPFGTVYQTGGYFSFNYTPSDTSYKTLNTYNMPTPTIANGAAYMAATLYTGNGSTGQSVVNTVNGVSFAPDFAWVKVRSTAGTDHYLADTVRGATKYLQANTTAAEGTNNGITAFNSNGFSVGAVGDTNTNGATIVGWNWKAGGTAVSNTSGSITSTVSVNQTAGFSVVTYTATAATGTIGHGLGVAPSMIITARRSSSGAYWGVYHQSLGASQILYMQVTNAATADSTTWNATSPTSSVFSVGNSAQSNNPASATYVAYCFAPIAGYSAFGSYTGNGSTDGTFVYLGFRPRWIMVKCSSNASTNWVVIDTSRDTYNLAGQSLEPNLSAAEYTPASSGYPVDILSNGFKWRDAGSQSDNYSGYTYIYAAFAETAFKFSLGR